MFFLSLLERSLSFLLVLTFMKYFHFIQDEVSIALGNSILKKGGQYEIVDFEQHLENPSLNCFKDIQM